MQFKIRRNLLSRGMAAIAVTTLAGAVMCLSGAGTASAATASLSLKYNCPFPLIGTQSLTIQVKASLPDKAVVGQVFNPIPFSADVTVPASATQGLNLVGAKTLTGSAVSYLTLANGSLKLPLGLPASFPNVQIPASGTFLVHASGTAPGVGLPNPGTFSLTMGNINENLTPLDAKGNKTGLGTFTSACTPAAGQKLVLATVPVSAK